MICPLSNLILVRDIPKNCLICSISKRMSFLENDLCRSYWSKKRIYTSSYAVSPFKDADCNFSTWKFTRFVTSKRCLNWKIFSRKVRIDYLRNEMLTHIFLVRFEKIPLKEGFLRISLWILKLLIWQRYWGFCIKEFQGIKILCCFNTQLEIFSQS